MLERTVKKLTDPATGNVPSPRKASPGLVEINTVAPKISAGTFRLIDIRPPKRGDHVPTGKK